MLAGNLAYLDPVDVRHNDIQQHQVKRFGLGVEDFQRLFTA